MQRPRRTRLLLELDVTRGLIDPPLPGWQRLVQRAPTMRGTLAALDRAAADPAVAGLLVRTGGGPQPLAAAQELRDGLLAFRAGGKPVWTWAESWGEHGPGTVAYFVATAGEQLWLQPTGDLGLTGIKAEATFLRDALDRAGVAIQVSTRHEFKSAPNMLTEREFTVAHRDNVQRCVSSAAEQVIRGIADARGIATQTVRELIDRAPLDAREALTAGLVDRLGYRDEAYGAMREHLGGDVELRYVSHYEAHPPAGQLIRRRLRRDRRRVGLIDIAGTIRLGPDAPPPLTRSAGSDRVCAALRAVAEADDVAAVVLRVDSPGGSYVASDAIWRATTRLRETGKPVVVSMARVAASGGYYVAMGANRIIALPGTLTGSIGVFAGKFVVADALSRRGIAHDAVQVGRSALAHSVRVRLDPDQLAKLDAMLDRIYADFTAKVGAARGLDPGAVDAVARGRVWTGADAHERGLVDELGGLATAVAAARRLADLPTEAPLRPFPTPSPLEFLRRPRSSEGPRGARAGGWVAGWGGWAEVAALAGLHPAGPLAAPRLEMVG